MAIAPLSEDQLRRFFPEIKELGLIGTGGFKLVYRIMIGEGTEALKFVEIPFSEESQGESEFQREAIGRVKREIDAISRCQSPALVKLGSLTPRELQIEGRDFVVYSEEFLNGPDLRSEIMSKPDEYPSEVELKCLFHSLLTAIKELWGLGLVHRDIKPGNVIKLNAVLRPFVLLDLGIAFAVQGTALTANPQDRLPPATYRYMAPEMMNPDFRDNIDYRSDLYTAAMTVFEYGARLHPLARSQDDLIQTISRTLHQPARPLKSLRPDLSDEFCQIIDQMLKKKPALRPANLNSLINKMKV